MSSLHQALLAEQGIVCAIGAGGKKTALYALLRAAEWRTALTASVFTPHFPDDLGASVHVASMESLSGSLRDDPGPRIAYALTTDKPRRVGPLRTEDIARLHADAGFQLTLVKADGARMRRIKAPGEHEPTVVADSTVLAISSLLALGRPLDDRIAHRPERVSAVTGHAEGEPISIATMAALYLREGGLTARTGNGPLVPVLNMADDDRLRRAGREVAAAILDQSERVDRVVLLSDRRAGHLVDVLLR